MIALTTIVIGLCGLVIALALLVAHLFRALGDFQEDLDHTHGMAHAAIDLLEHHLTGDDITIHHMRLRTDDKEE